MPSRPCSAGRRSAPKGRRAAADLSSLPLSQSACGKMAMPRQPSNSESPSETSGRPTADAPAAPAPRELAVVSHLAQRQRGLKLHARFGVGRARQHRVSNGFGRSSRKSSLSCRRLLANARIGILYCTLHVRRLQARRAHRSSHSAWTRASAMRLEPPCVLKLRNRPTDPAVRAEAVCASDGASHSDCASCCTSSAELAAPAWASDRPCRTGLFGTMR